MYITKSINVEGKELRREREKRKKERRRVRGEGKRRLQEAGFYMVQSLV